MRTLSKKQSRTLAIGLLLLGLVLCTLVLFIPARLLHRHYDQAQASALDYLERYQRIAAARADLQTALDGIGKLDARKHFLKNTGAALAASEIQEIAKNLIEANKGRLNSMQIVPQKEEGGYRRVTVTIQLITNITMLRKILYAVEAMQPYLLVDNVSIRAQPNAMYRPIPGVEPEVTAQFDISGYALVADGKVDGKAGGK